MWYDAVRIRNSAEFVLFIDILFDSGNGSRINAKSGKYMKTAVTTNSEHLTFCVEAIQVLETVSFFNVNKSNIVPLSIKNWIHTLKGFKYLFLKLNNLGFRFLCSRIGSLRSFLPINNYTTYNSLRDGLTEAESTFITEKAYSCKALLFPQTKFNLLFSSIIYILSKILPNYKSYK